MINRLLRSAAAISSCASKQSGIAEAESENDLEALRWAESSGCSVVAGTDRPLASAESHRPKQIEAMDFGVIVVIFDYGDYMHYSLRFGLHCPLRFVTFGALCWYLKVWLNAKARSIKVRSIEIDERGLMSPAEILDTNRTVVISLVSKPSCCSSGLPVLSSACSSLTRVAAIRRGRLWSSVVSVNLSSLSRR